MRGFNRKMPWGDGAVEGPECAWCSQGSFFQFGGKDECRLDVQVAHVPQHTSTKCCSRPGSGVKITPASSSGMAGREKAV